MKKFSLLYGLFCVGLALTTILQFEGCANIVPPGGGPRDSLPPYLIAADRKSTRLNSSH